jgi:subtilisin family serine protease
MAQSDDFTFADDRFIVRVVEGIAPTELADGWLSFSYEQEADQPPMGAIAELLIAELLEGFGATAIEPIIDFELRPEILAIAIESGIMREYTVDVPAGTDILLVTELLSFFVTHLEYVAPAWNGVPLQTSDPLFDDQWQLHNTGQELWFPCRLVQGEPFCGICGNAEGLPGTPDSDIDAPEAWELETGSSDVVVAVIDVGVDKDHPDLRDKLVSGKNYVEGPNECPDACMLPDDPENDCPEAECDTSYTSHGTRIAGIIAAATNNGKGIAGVSHGALVMPLRISEKYNEVEVKKALTDATNDPDVKIINMSFTAVAGTLDTALSTASGGGKLLISGVGNCWITPPEGCTEPVTYPASHEDVMAVSSTNFKDERSCFTKMGPEVSVAAPGEDIVSTHNPDSQFDCNRLTDPDLYCRGNGTSFSGPHVAGVAALIWSVDLNFGPEEVRRFIQATADDLGDTGHDSAFGCGRINAFRAVCRALCPANIDDVCAVGIVDFLQLLAGWGPCPDQCCPADLNDDGTVGINDFLILLASWGSCPRSLAPPPPSLEEEIAAAGLTQEEWDTLVDCVVTGTEEESANCVCWMEHYMDCHRRPDCEEPDPVLCSGADPLGNH